MSHERLKTLTSQWRKDLFTDKDWVQDPDPPTVGDPGGGDGFFAISEQGDDRLTGYVKPTHRRRDTPYPAVEKICADIGVELEMPVAPVLLYVREDTQDPLKRHSSVSLVPYRDLWSWPPHGWKPETDKLREWLIDRLRPVSGMVAFDGFVANWDRNDNRPNVVIYEPPGLPELPAFIDHANSLSRQGRWNHGGPTTVRVEGMPSLLREAVDPEGVLDYTSRIESLGDATIDDIVLRIPESYMDPNQRSVVAAALKRRRGLVRGVVTEWLRGRRA